MKYCSLVVECQTRNRWNPGSIPFAAVSKLGIFALAITPLLTQLYK